MQTEESELKYFQYKTLTRTQRKTVACENNAFTSLGSTALQSKELQTLNVEEGLSWGQLAKRFKMGTLSATAMPNRSETHGLVIKNPNPLNALTENFTFTDKSQDQNPKIQKTGIDPENIFESLIDEFVKSQKTPFYVIPAKAGIQLYQ